MKLKCCRLIPIFAWACVVVNIPSEGYAREQVNLSNVQDQRTDFETHALYSAHHLNELLYGPSWFRTRGYVYGNNRSYRAYNEDDLISLARGGDPVAEVLAINKPLVGNILDGDSFRELVEFHESAVINGYSSTFMWIIEAYLFRAREAQDIAMATTADSDSDSGPIIDSLVPDSPKQDIIKALVWTLVAQMRSDPHGDRTAGGFQSYGLNEKEGAASCRIANVLYDKLNSARQARGHAPFRADPPMLANTDISDFGVLCTKWPVPRLSCVQQKVDADLMPLSGYRCTPKPEKQNASL